MLQPGWLKKDRRQAEGERRINGDRGLRCSADKLAFEKQQGPSENQQEPGSTGRRSIRTRKLCYRVKSCSYTNIKRNQSALQESQGAKARTTLNSLHFIFLLHELNEKKKKSQMMKYRSFYFLINHSSRSFWSFITFLLNFYMSFGISGLLLVSPVAFTVLTSTAYNWHCSGKYCDLA